MQYYDNILFFQNNLKVLTIKEATNQLINTLKKERRYRETGVNLGIVWVFVVATCLAEVFVFMCVLHYRITMILVFMKT